MWLPGLEIRKEVERKEKGVQERGCPDFPLYLD
jgi:hypothetical protein